jgi:hypothetical protein
MKTIQILKTTTQAEILINLALAISFMISGLTGCWHITVYLAAGIAILHTLSLLLHWLVWKQLPVTQPYRLILNLWVLSSFAYTLLFGLFLGPWVLVMLYALLLFSLMWFVFTLHILLKEYDFLNRKIELYAQRELIHF